MSASPVSPAVVLKAFRDLGVPPDHDEGQLACDPSFSRYAAFWLTGPTLDASYAGIEALELLRHDEAVRCRTKVRARLLEILRNHVFEERFRTNGSDVTGGIYAQHVAIDLMRCHAAVPREEPFGVQRFRRMLEELDVKATEKSLLDLVLLTRDESYGAFADSPASALPPSVTTCYVVIAVMWNLFGLDGPKQLFRILRRDRIRDFFENCIRHETWNGVDVVGFIPNPDLEELCVNTTYFALKAIRRLGLESEVIDTQRRELVWRFFMASFDEGQGGFRSTRREPVSLNATHFALLAMRSFGEDRANEFCSRHASQIGEFIHACFGDSGGAAFSPRHDMHVENCLATRYALRILGVIDTDDHGDRSSAQQFLCQQFDETVPCFRSYPQHRITQESGDMVRRIAGVLRERDQHLLQVWRGKRPINDYELEQEVPHAVSELVAQMRSRLHDDRAVRAAPELIAFADDGIGMVPVGHPAALVLTCLRIQWNEARREGVWGEPARHAVKEGLEMLSRPTLSGRQVSEWIQRSRRRGATLDLSQENSRLDRSNQVRVRDGRKSRA